MVQIDENGEEVAMSLPYSRRTLIKAIISILGDDTVIYSVFFPFKQSMWRKIQDLMLASVYKGNSKVHKFLKLPHVLAYDLVGDVVDLFIDLKVDLKGFSASCEFSIFILKNSIMAYYQRPLLPVVVSLKPRKPLLDFNQYSL